MHPDATFAGELYFPRFFLTFKVEGCIRMQPSFVTWGKNNIFLSPRCCCFCANHTLLKTTMTLFIRTKKIRKDEGHFFVYHDSSFRILKISKKSSNRKVRTKLVLTNRLPLLVADYKGMLPARNLNVRPTHSSR